MVLSPSKISPLRTDTFDAKRSVAEMPLTMDGRQLLTSAHVNNMRIAQCKYRLVADGLKNREIAQRLKVKEHSIRNYIYRIFEKLGVSSRVELILYVFSHRDSSN